MAARCAGGVLICLGLWLSAAQASAQESPGQGASSQPAEVRAERGWQFSGDGGATWSDGSPVVPGGKAAAILARTSFDVPDPHAGAFWALRHALPARLEMRFRLNGQDVPVPLEGMYYKTLPGVPAGLLRRGHNDLTVTIRVDNRPPAYDRARVMPDVAIQPAPGAPTLTPQTLQIQTGPVVGAFGEDYFSVTCRTNLPAKVELTPGEARPAGGREPASQPAVLTAPEGMFHRFRVPRTQGAARVRYEVRAVRGDQAARLGPYEVALPVFDRQSRPDGRLRFVIMGDSRTETEDWATVAAAVLKEKPELVVFTGDMCSSGPNDWEWDEHFFAPPSARELLATVPFYAVKGNHEEDAPLFSVLFYTPTPDGKDENWAQQVGPVLLVGIDGQWSPTWQQTHRWIERTLAQSKARFIFFVTHYPAYSSAANGKLDEQTGKPRHWAYLTGRDVLVPMLARHKAAAMVVSHEHHYERSGLPGGLVQIISGGAGAPRSGKSLDAERQNPYSKVFVKTLNYCLFEVAGDTCTFTAKTPGGQVIDRLAWSARKVP